MAYAATPVTAGPLDPMDWPQWRGPLQNGVSYEHNLPERWSVDGENLLWRKPEYATRSTPIVFDGRLYSICRAFPESTREGEKIVCLDAASGDLVWEAVNNVFLTDAPAERVGWSSVVADPETASVYALGLGCYFQCLDAKTGAVRWAHSMSEEYGMLSTYGGRTNFPIVFEDLVIISGVMTGWGDAAVPAHRFVAFDKRTGQAVWFASTQPRPEDTTYCTPIITYFDGQAAMVVGGGDGMLYAFQPRTGKVIWKYNASNRGINTTPLVHDGIVYCGHSEQNANAPDVLGAIFALDGRQQGEVAESDLLWKIPGRPIGRSQPLLVENRLYVVEDSGTLWILDAGTGQEIGKQKLGRIMFGSLVYGDGKLFAGEATGRWYILKPTDKGVEVIHQMRLPEEEILGSPIISHGRIYLPTNAALYCIGLKDATPSSDPLPTGPAETPLDADSAVTHLQVVPVESLIASGDKLHLKVRAFNARGQFVKDVQAEFTVEGPASVDSTGLLVSDPAAGHAAAIVTAKAGDISGTARVRMVPPLPWSFDFSDKKVPVTWIGATYRHQPRDLEGEPVLVKISTIPKGTRSQSWMGPTDLHDYTVEADLLATERNGKRPDMGLINQRYTLALNAAQELEIRSWTSRLELRFAKTIPFSWEAGTWYTMKFQSENAQGQAVLRGKVWPRSEAEPADWTIEAADATPNTVGSPGMFGNASDAEFFIDNVKVYANP
ncbi:MAG: outer membrane protein assembly factor BamB family protein [Pirellulaceae bacterium]